MNTIFLDITKQYLISAIDKTIKESIDKDNAFLAQARERLHVPRDKALSETKRENLRLLRKKLLDYNPKDAKDDCSMQELMRFIRDYQSVIATILRAKNMSPGSSDIAIAKALDFIQFIYAQFERAMLLETRHNQHPFHIFKYYIGHYFALKIIEQQNMSSIQDATEHPSISNYRVRASKREELIIRAIRSCAEQLALMKNGQEETDTLKNFVSDRITLLEREDNDLRQEYGRTLSFTTSVLSLLNLTNTDDLILIDQLKEAHRGIQEKNNGIAKGDDWEDVTVYQAPHSTVSDEVELANTRVVPHSAPLIEVARKTTDGFVCEQNVVIEAEASIRNVTTTEENTLIQEALLRFSFLRDQQKEREAISPKRDQEKPNPPAPSVRKRR